MEYDLINELKKLKTALDITDIQKDINEGRYVMQSLYVGEKERYINKIYIKYSEYIKILNILFKNNSSNNAKPIITHNQKILECIKLLTSIMVDEFFKEVEKVYNENLNKIRRFK